MVDLPPTEKTQPNLQVLDSLPQVQPTGPRYNHLGSGALGLAVGALLGSLATYAIGISHLEERLNYCPQIVEALESKKPVAEIGQLVTHYLNGNDVAFGSTGALFNLMCPSGSRSQRKDFEKNVCQAFPDVTDGKGACQKLRKNEMMQFNYDRKK